MMAVDRSILLEEVNERNSSTHGDCEDANTSETNASISSEDPSQDESLSSTSLHDESMEIPFVPGDVD